MIRAIAFATSLALTAPAASAFAGDKLFHERSGGPAVMPLPSLAPLVKQIRPAVVNIATSQKLHRSFGGGQTGDPMFDQFFGQFFGGAPQQQLERNSLGSGFIVNERGYVLTNNHVIDGADKIHVRLADGREFDAKVVGTDPKTDVALVKILSTDTNFPYVSLGDSDALEVGDWVVAIGNPFGIGLSVTHGLVSAKERTIGAGPYDDFIQSDALINPGNSGGPLFGLSGEVVGINTAITSHGQGIGFAVPINLAKQLIPQLETGKIVRGWLGVSIQSLTPDLAQSLALPSNKGALVAQVIRGGPAQKGGLKNGDVVVALNGRPIATANELTRDIAGLMPGTKVGLDVLRDGKKESLKVRIGERPEDGQLVAQAGEGDAAPRGPPKPDALGLAVGGLDPERTQGLGLGAGDGVVVTEVRADGPAAQAGVERGDVVLEVNRHAVHSVEDYQQQLQRVKAGDMVLLRLQRQSASIYVAVKI